MLSRFSKLPGISSLLPYNNYPREAIDAAVSDIKKLGKQTNNNEDTLQGITKILSLMKKYSDSLHVQRVSCHALSNLAMQVVVARWIVQKGGFNLIKKCLTKFQEDHKLCWLGSSAIWNMARPPANRSIIGSDGVKIMLKMLKIHREREKVTNTSIGALSNLSLCEKLKKIIAEPAHIEIILSVLKCYSNKQSLSVMTSGAGLVANLAVSDSYASLLVKKQSLPVLLQLLQWKCDSMDDTLYRNTCAALNNMVTAESFLDEFLKARGVEHIFQFLMVNNHDLYTNLLENCLINIEVDTSTPTTSLHLCSLHGRFNILKGLLKDYPLSGLNEKDSKKMTCLDYAISMKHIKVIKFLSKCGATEFQQNILKDVNSANNGNKGNNDTNNDEMRKQIENALEQGKKTLHVVRDCTEQSLYKTLPAFSKDLCNLVISYNANVDMLQGMKRY